MAKPDIVSRLKQVDPASGSHHFASALHLPDASWSVFFLTGALLPGWLPLAGLLALAAMVDYLAISFGGLILSWMNDSGFWVVSRLGGLSETQTLRSWTVVVTVNSVAGLVACLILSRLLPFV